MRATGRGRMAVGQQGRVSTGLSFMFPPQDGSCFPFPVPSQHREDCPAPTPQQGHRPRGPQGHGDWGAEVATAQMRGPQGCMKGRDLGRRLEGGCQSGWGRLLSVTNATEAGTWCEWDRGWA